eukprot:10568281-Alexandrium_andersonii.AAC.1
MSARALAASKPSFCRASCQALAQQSWGHPACQSHDREAELEALGPLGLGAVCGHLDERRGPVGAE